MLTPSKSMLAAATVFAGMILGVAPAALAEESTTTTTTEHHEDGAGAIITAPARAAGAIVDTVVGRPEGCTHKSVTKTDTDTGESVTKSKTDCD